MCNEMTKLRKMLNDEEIEWRDASSFDFLFINRTHFEHRKYFWSAINGYGTYGGDKGLLELMSNGVNGGEPIGYLTAEECMAYVRGERDE